MKAERVHFRIESNLKRYFEQAAAHENKTLCAFLIEAGRERTEALRAKGWTAKSAPESRDGRRAA